MDLKRVQNHQRDSHQEHSQPFNHMSFKVLLNVTQNSPLVLLEDNSEIMFFPSQWLYSH